MPQLHWGAGFGPLPVPICPCGWEMWGGEGLLLADSPRDVWGAIHIELDVALSRPFIHS